MSPPLQDEPPVTPPHRGDGASDLWRVTANALSAAAAVLDERGEIIAVNDSWRRFALAEGGGLDLVGANYLDRACVVVSHENVTQRKHSERSAQLQALLLDEVDVAVHTTDLDRNVTSWKAGAEQLFGSSADEAIGRKTDEVCISAEAPVDPEVRKRIGKRFGTAI